MAYLFKKKYIRTDGRTNERTDGRTVRLYYAPKFIWGHKNSDENDLSKYTLKKSKAIFVTA